MKNTVTIVCNLKGINKIFRYEFCGTNAEIVKELASLRKLGYNVSVKS